jgi:hypothetical protein
VPIVEAGGDLLLCRRSLLPLASGNQQAVRLTAHEGCEDQADPPPHVPAYAQTAEDARRARYLPTDAATLSADRGLATLHSVFYSFCMKATTIKVEGELLEELERTKPPRQSLSAYVRALLQQAVVRRRMIDAADRYAEFVRDTPEERTWLVEWDSADLVTPPKRRRR